MTGVEQSDHLFADVNTALKLWLLDDSPFWRRTLFRVIFSYMDAQSYAMKMSALQRHEEGKFTLKIKDLAIINEERYEIDDKGRARVKPYFGRFENNLKYAFNIICESLETTFQPNYSDGRWGQLKQAVKIRNRITHFKSVGDMDVSREELQFVLDGLKWYQDNVIRLLAIQQTDSAAELSQHQAEYDQLLDKLEKPKKE